jgi:hypothetical protein
MKSVDVSNLDLVISNMNCTGQIQLYPSSYRPLILYNSLLSPDWLDGHYNYDLARVEGGG